MADRPSLPCRRVGAAEAPPSPAHRRSPELCRRQAVLAQRPLGSSSRCRLEPWREPRSLLLSAGGPSAMLAVVATIGAFAAQAAISTQAIRSDDEVGVLVPALPSRLGLRRRRARELCTRGDARHGRRCVGGGGWSLGGWARRASPTARAVLRVGWVRCDDEPSGCRGRNAPLGLQRVPPGAAANGGGGPQPLHLVLHWTSASLLAAHLRPRAHGPRADHAPVRAVRARLPSPRVVMASAGRRPWGLAQAAPTVRGAAPSGRSTGDRG